MFRLRWFWLKVFWSQGRIVRRWDAEKRALERHEWEHVIARPSSVERNI
jgi:hypothetical protein